MPAAKAGSFGTIWFVVRIFGYAIIYGIALLFAYGVVSPMAKEEPARTYLSATVATLGVAELVLWNAIPSVSSQSEATREVLPAIIAVVAANDYLLFRLQQGKR